MRTLQEIKTLSVKILSELYLLEDYTNYEVKKISKCVDIMQTLNLDKEFKKSKNTLTIIRRRK